MDGQNEYLAEKHKEIYSLCRNTLPFYSRGREKRFLRVILFILWCIIWLESGKRYASLSYVYLDSDARAVVVAVLLCVLGYFIFKPYKIFTERTYFGKIEVIEKQRAETIKKDKHGKKVHIKDIHSGLYDGTNMLIVRTPTGRLKKKKVPNLVAFDSIYDIDIPVSVMSGEKFPVPLTRDFLPGNRCFCTRCGSFERLEKERCSMCFSLLWYK